MKDLNHVADVIPHTDATEEMDCHTMLPDHVIHMQRMWLDEVTEEAEQKMVAEELPMTLRYLKGAVPYKCAVFGCTSASAANGMEGMVEIQRRMEEELGYPSFTVLRAVLHEIERHKCPSVAVLTPYTDEVNAFIRKTIERFGVHVPFIAGMGSPDDTQVAALKPEQILDYARSQKERIPETADLCFFSCTNVCWAEVRSELAEIMGKPFITSNQCVMDHIRSLG